MSDEMWRRRERSGDTSDTGEFGGPLFPDDDDEKTSRPGNSDDSGERRLRFGPNDTGPLPHWTDPPTGEIPQVAPQASGKDPEDEDEVDVWSQFTTETPVWRDDEPSTETASPADRSGGIDRDVAGEVGEVRSDSSAEPPSGERSGEIPLTPPPPRREPGRITIGTDPSGVPRRTPATGPRRRGGVQQRSGRPAGPARTAAGTTASARDMPAAIIAGVALAVLFILATLWRPVGVLILVVAVLAVAAFEYFGKVTEKGYRPAVAPGLAACVAAPLAAYWVGDDSLPLVVAFAFIAGAAGFIGANGVESGPLPNMAITTLGVVWIGVLGSFAALIVRLSNEGGGNNIGTDTLFFVVLGVVANDIGALLVGSSIGKTPLRAWISPAKTVEGVIGGSLMTIVVLFVAGLTDQSDTWSTGDLLLLAIVIAIMAPLGDLTESMFKRNLDVKDFGSLLSGHGGVLDRFDAFLFVLPAAYYLTLVLEPWK
jgi:phosphatidate cytidylyltransferase